MIKDTSATDILVAPQRALKGWQVMVAVILTVTVSSTAWGLITWNSVEQSVSGARLRFASVVKGDFVRDVSVQGRIVAASSPTLYSPTQGIIKLQIRSGDRVSAGQLLATIDSPALKNRLAQENSGLSQLHNEVQRQSISTRKLQLRSQQNIDLAEVQLAAARREMRRAELSVGSHAISQIDYEKSADDLNTALLQFEHAKQDALLEKESLEFELTTRKLDLERQQLKVADIQRQIQELQITAPVSGIIGDLAVKQRQNVSPNLPLLTVVDLTAFEVEILIPETYADDIGIDMTAELSLDGKLLAAVVTAISPEVINNQVKARLKFDRADIPGLKQNQRMTARILIESKTGVLKVQRGPFFDSGAGRIAYRVKDGIATKTAITTGSTSISEIEVLGGLVEGDSIVVSSHEPFNKAQSILIN
jgi:HlyD family secretion protein